MEGAGKEALDIIEDYNARDPKITPTAKKYKSRNNERTGTTKPPVNRTGRRQITLYERVMR